MGKLKIKKPKKSKKLNPGALNITGFTMEQASRQTGVRIESLKMYLDSKEQEIREQLIKESQEKLWKAEDYIAVANILISVIAIKKAWGFKKANQNFIDKITEAERYVEEIGVEAAYKEIKEEMGLQIDLILLILIGNLGSESIRRKDESNRCNQRASRTRRNLRRKKRGILENSK